LPTLNADIINNGGVKGDTGYIVRLGGLLTAVTLVQICCAEGAVYFGARTAMAVGRDLRAAVLAQVQNFSAREVGQFGTPTLITRTTNDGQQVQMLALTTFTLMVSASIMAVGGILMALNQDVPLSGLLLVVVPLLAVIVAVIISRMRPLFRLMQTRERRTGDAREVVLNGLDIAAAASCLLGGHSDRGHLGLGERHLRDDAVAGDVRAAGVVETPASCPGGDDVAGDPGLVLAHVGEQRTAAKVTDGVQPVRPGPREASSTSR
jgi:hypothetical protein